MAENDNHTVKVKVTLFDIETGILRVDAEHSTYDYTDGNYALFSPHSHGSSVVPRGSIIAQRGGCGRFAANYILTLT